MKDYGFLRRLPRSGWCPGHCASSVGAYKLRGRDISLQPAELLLSVVHVILKITAAEETSKVQRALELNASE